MRGKKNKVSPVSNKIRNQFLSSDIVYLWNNSSGKGRGPNNRWNVQHIDEACGKLFLYKVDIIHFKNKRWDTPSYFIFFTSASSLHMWKPSSNEIGKTYYTKQERCCRGPRLGYKNCHVNLKKKVRHTYVLPMSRLVTTTYWGFDYKHSSLTPCFVFGVTINAYSKLRHLKDTGKSPCGWGLYSG